MKDVHLLVLVTVASCSGPSYVRVTVNDRQFASPTLTIETMVNGKAGSAVTISKGDYPRRFVLQLEGQSGHVTLRVTASDGRVAFGSTDVEAGGTADVEITFPVDDHTVDGGPVVDGSDCKGRVCRPGICEWGSGCTCVGQVCGLAFCHAGLDAGCSCANIRCGGFGGCLFGSGCTCSGITCGVGGCAAGSGCMEPPDMGTPPDMACRGRQCGGGCVFGDGCECSGVPCGTGGCEQPGPCKCFGVQCGVGDCGYVGPGGCTCVGIMCGLFSCRGGSGCTP